MVVKNEVYQKAFDALKAGKSEAEMHEEIYGEPLEGETLPDEVGSETDESEDVLGMLSQREGEPSEDSTEPVDNETGSLVDEVGSQDDPAKEDQPEADVEFIEADGKRIKIDYTDRKRIKQAHAAMIGMRKFQRERDEARKSLKDYEPLKKKAEDFDKLDQLFQDEGVEGVVAQLAGRTLDEIVQERIDRIILSEENPMKAAQLEWEEKLERERRSRERLERQMEQQSEQTRAERESADEARLESMIQPVFSQYSFSGKMGDADAEHAMDEALWNQAIARLESYPEGTELTPAMIRKEFRQVATTFGRVINKQVDQKTQTVITSKRAAAKESLQKAVADGTADKSANSEFVRKYKSGNMTGALIDVLKGKAKL